MKWLRLAAFALVALSLILAAAQSVLAVNQRAIAFGLEPVGASGISGTVTITAGAGQADVATLVLDVQGLTSGQSYPVHLHAGTCAAPSASTGLLGTLLADKNGRATLTTNTVKMGASGLPVTLTLALLGDGDHVIDVHDATTVACAGIPKVGDAPTEGNGGGLALLPVAGIVGALGVFALGVSLFVSRG